MQASQRGENFTIELNEGHVYARVFKRTDVGHAEGAEFAKDFVGRMRDLADQPPDAVVSVVLDLRQAPVIAGPITMRAMSELFAAFEAASRRVAVVVGDEAIKAAQYRTIVSRHAPKFARVVASPAEAGAWCQR